MPVEEDELVAALRAHRRKAMNLKTYENIGKSQTPDGPGLVKLYDLVMAILGVCPAANISKDMWRRAAMQMNRVYKGLNSTELTNRSWAGQRAERWMTVLNHVRRLYNSSDVLAKTLKGLSKESRRKLSAIIARVSRDADSDTSSNASKDRREEEVNKSDGSPKKKPRLLKQNDSIGSNVSTDSLGIPTILASPEKQSQQSPKKQTTREDMASSKKQKKQKKDKQQESKDEGREGKLDLDDRSAGTDEPDPSLYHAGKSPKKSPTLPVSPKKKPAANEAAATSTRTVHDTIGGPTNGFEAVITYATLQSYWHHVDKGGKRSFMCAKGGKGHQKRLEKLINDLKKRKWTKGMKAAKVKAVAQAVSQKY